MARLPRYDVYNVTKQTKQTLTTNQITKQYLISQEDLEWALEEYGICECQNDGDEIAIVSQGDDLNLGPKVED